MEFELGDIVFNRKDISAFVKPQRTRWVASISKNHPYKVNRVGLLEGMSISVVSLMNGNWLEFADSDDFIPLPIVNGGLGLAAEYPTNPYVLDMYLHYPQLFGSKPKLTLKDLCQ